MKPTKITASAPAPLAISPRHQSAAGNDVPPMNSQAMVDYCAVLTNILWDSAKADTAFTKAIGVIKSVAAGSFDSDTIRTLTFTQKVTAALTGSSE